MKTTLKNKIYFKLDLTYFDTVINATTSAAVGNDLSAENKTTYDKILIRFATPKLVHAQFGQKRNIPSGGGKTVEFRKYSQLPKALTALTEGVTPSGNKMNVTTITATVSQYGDYLQLSDMLILSAIDNNIVEATRLIGDQAGRTLDTVIREILNGGTSVQYAAGAVTHRYDLDQTSDKITVDAIKRASRYLQANNAPMIDGSYVAIIHPDTAYDLMADTKWEDAVKYTTSEKIFNGEIGRIAGVRFVQTTEAKIFHAANLTAGARKLTVKTAISGATTTVTVNEVITSGDATALVGRKVLIGSAQYEVASANAAAAGSASIVLTTSIASASANADIFPGEAGTAGIDVYSTLVLGAEAFGTTEIEGGGLETIIKQKGSAGTADALNQRATVGWKATLTAERLVETNMIRIETASTFESGAN